ncbi:MAG TPA: glycosyltransferase, partial [Pyrinomonadaceae bacterium]|nr:glycosyltransferase [Pyrinomonadaceae bacterium]
TYRSLIKALHARGHTVTFLERNVPWYGDHRDLTSAPYCRIELYDSLADVPRHFSRLVSEANLVIVGSYVPDGAVLADWVTMHAQGVTAFYDIDTPVTLARLEKGDAEYIIPTLIPRFDLYLSFTGGPVLSLIEQRYGSPRARVLYCGVDPNEHAPVSVKPKWCLGYLGTYSPDRQPMLEHLLIESARRLPSETFVVAGPQYPTDISWPRNVERIEHLPPDRHGEFFSAQRFTLNVTRRDMTTVGYSPSVRLFEAAACGVPIISDEWTGLDTFFVPGTEILIANASEQMIDFLREFPEPKRQKIALAARKRVLQSHTAERRAHALEEYYSEVFRSRRHGGNRLLATVEAVA